MEFWAERFGENDIDFEGPFERFGHKVMRFKDPDLVQLELVFDPKVKDVPAWDKSTVPAEHGIRGFWGTTLKLESVDETATLLEQVFGFRKIAEDGNKSLYQTGAVLGNAVIIEKVEPKRGVTGRGTIHHVAFRTKDEQEQDWMRKEVMKHGLAPTRMVERHFFKSVYFTSPGGVLFEIATDGPGYKAIQPEEDLGHKLYLPSWLENRREMIEMRLPEIKI